MWPSTSSSTSYGRIKPLIVSSASNTIVDRFQVNFSPTNVGMEPVYWHGQDKAALLYNGGWLWDVKSKVGRELPNLPPPNGNAAHRMGFWDRDHPIRLAASADLYVGWPVTLQLKDRSLITAYALTAYLHQPPETTATEIVHWRLP